MVHYQHGISLLCLYGCSTLKFITTGEPEWEGQHTKLQRNLFGGGQIPESHTSGLMCLFFVLFWPLGADTPFQGDAVTCLILIH